MVSPHQNMPGACVGLGVLVAAESPDNQGQPHYDQEGWEEWHIEAEEDYRRVDNREQSPEPHRQNAEFQPQSGPDEIHQEHQKARAECEDRGVDNNEWVAPSFEGPEYTKPDEEDSPEGVGQCLALQYRESVGAATFMG